MVSLLMGLKKWCLFLSLRDGHGATLRWGDGGHYWSWVREFLGRVGCRVIPELPYFTPNSPQYDPNLPPSTRKRCHRGAIRAHKHPLGATTPRGWGGGWGWMRGLAGRAAGQVDSGRPATDAPTDGPGQTGRLGHRRMRMPVDTMQTEMDATDLMAAVARLRG